MIALLDRLKAAMPRREHRAVTIDMVNRLDTRNWSADRLIAFWGDERAQFLPDVPGRQLVPPGLIRTGFDWTVFPGLRSITEVIRQPLYSYDVYPAAGTLNLQLFTLTEGNSPNRRADTNMKTSGNLPGGEAQIVSSVRVFIFPSVTDVQSAAAGAPPAIGQWMTVLNTGIIEISTSDKEYLVGSPLTLFPQGCGLGTVYGGAATVLLNLSLPNNGSPDNNALFIMDPPFALRPLVPFKVLLRWGALAAVTTVARIGVALDGWKVRLVL